MTKIRSLSELQDELDRDFSWRIHEFSGLRKLIPTNGGKYQVSLIRANLAILYAHWEGFIKNSSGYYLEFVNRKGLKASELLDCFAYLGLKKKMNTLVETKKADHGLMILQQIRSDFSEPLPLSFDGVLRTDSNLKSEVFTAIATSLGFSIDRYVPYFNLIDESLLKQRNGIAHGEYLEIDLTRFNEIADRVIMLLRWFKADIEIAASNGNYRFVAKK